MTRKLPRTGLRRLCPYPRVALTFQGGGALGAYQAGVYQALAEADLLPDWVAGISIGAINAAIIAGNPPVRRVERLRQFWEMVSENPVPPLAGVGDPLRHAYTQLSALMTMLFGQPGFFRPRAVPPWLHPAGSVGATSFYSTDLLRETLADFVDFDLINAGATRLSVGAVAVRSGNFAYFDSARRPITAAHVMASGALPPGFPGVEIDGELYWDGGLVSNTPLQYVLEDTPFQSTLVFEVDLFSARGPVPRTMDEVLARQKEIIYSSRTRENTDSFRRLHDMRRGISRLIERLPEELQHEPEIRALREFGSDAVMNIVHLIYRGKDYETQSRDYEFSRSSMAEHWSAGYDDARHTLRHADWLAPPPADLGVAVHDLTRTDSIEQRRRR
jgi:NTE family protein